MANSELRAGPLEGAVVQRADVARRVAVLQARVPGETWILILGAAKGACGVGVVPSESRARARALLSGQETSRTERERIEGGAVVQIDARGVTLQSRGELVRLFVDPGGGRVALATPSPALDASRRDEAPSFDLDASLAAGEALVRALGPALLDDAKASALAKIAKARARFERRRDAVRADLARATDVDALAAKARWFVAEAARAPRGARELTVTDWSTGEARAVTLPLDPGRSPRENVEAIFARARRLQRGAAVANERLAETEAHLARLDEAARALRAAATHADLDREARSAGLAPSEERTAKAPRAVVETRRAYRVFHAGAGSPILVGKGAADNDTLTLHVAKPHDLWLHAKGAKGAHVILPLAKGKDATGDALVDAAHLAAHFSSAKGEPTVEIAYAPRGRVRKPKGAAPGLVRVDREKVLLVRIEPERLKALLASEEG